MPDDNGSGSASVDRRTYLQAAGVTGAVVGMGSLLTGTAAAETIHLGEEGIQSGDDAGAWLSRYIDDNREIVIPAGTYQYSQQAFSRGHSSGYADLTVRGEGEFGDVVFDHGDGHRFSEVIAANGGDVLVDNIVWRGVSSGNGNITVRARSGDEVTLRRVARPDGNRDRGEGVFVRNEHAGVANFEHCWLENFPDNGLYGSAPASTNNGNDGEVNVSGGLYKNCTIAALRLGGSNSTVEGATVVQDAPPNTNSPYSNQRCLWIREGDSSKGLNITIRDCDVYNEQSYAAIEIHPRNNGGSGTIENTRIYNESDLPAVNVRGGDWSGRDNHSTGPGNLRIDTGSNNCEGPRCDVAANTARTPIGDRDAGGDQETELPEMDPHLVTFITTDGAPEWFYQFTATGPIEPVRDAYDSPSGNPVGATSNFEISREDDEYVAEGSSGNGFGDAFEVYGPITEVTVDEDMIIELDGDRVDEDELVERTRPEADDDDAADGTDDEADSDDDERTDDTEDPTQSDESETNGSSGMNVVVVDGSASDDVSQYVLTVSGEIERSETHTSIVNEGLAWDTLPSNVSDDKAIGVVGQGADGYRYTGNLISVEVRGNAALRIDRE